MSNHCSSGSFIRIVCVLTNSVLEQLQFYIQLDVDYLERCAESVIHSDGISYIMR